MTEEPIEDAVVVNADGTTDEQPKSPNIKFGFVVLVDTDGNMFIERSAQAIVGVPCERDATLIEVRRYSQEIVFDLAAQAAAEYTAMKLKNDQAAPQQ